MRKIGFFMLLIIGALVVLILPIGRGKSITRYSSTIGVDMQAFLLNGSKDNLHFLNTVEDLNASAVKIPIYWQHVELTSGLFNWTLKGIESQLDLVYLISELNQDGVDVIAVLNGYPDYLTYENGDESLFVNSYIESWERYVHAVVDQFGDEITFWQIGTGINLPDNLSGASIAEIILSGPATYAEKLKRASDIIKTADSNDILIAGGIKSETGNCLNQPSAFLHSLNTLEAWESFDVIGIELQTFNSAPEQLNAYQTYDILSGTCLTSADGGFNLEEIISFANSTAVQFGAKPIWVSGLKWNNEQLQDISELRALPIDAVRADYLARASLSLLGNNHVERVVWDYPISEEKESETFSVFTRQVYRNLNSSLHGFMEIQDFTLNTEGVKEKRFITPSVTQIYTWRSFGQDEFIPHSIHNLNDYEVEAFSLDADSLIRHDGIALSVDQNGNTSIALSERPVIISAYSNNMKERALLYLKSIFPSIKSGFEENAQGLIEAGKEKASQEVDNWVDEQKESFFTMLKDSFMNWLKETINVE